MKQTVAARRLWLLGAAAAIAMAVTATGAAAAPYKFDFTRANQPTVRFFIDDPVPVTKSNTQKNFFTTAHDATSGGSFAQVYNLTFLSSSRRDNNGYSVFYSIYDYGTSTQSQVMGYVNSGLGQLYTGPESAPTFKVGTYNLGVNNRGQASSFDKLSITGGPTAPGPLAGVGLLPALAAFGALGASRARRRRVMPRVRASFTTLARYLPRLPAPRVTVAFAR